VQIVLYPNFHEYVIIHNHTLLNSSQDSVIHFTPDNGTYFTTNQNLIDMEPFENINVNIDLFPSPEDENRAWIQ
jgi:hypothetical protein